MEVDSVVLFRQCVELLFIQGLGLPHQGYIFRAADQQAGHQQDRKERSRFLVGVPSQHSLLAHTTVNPKEC